MSEASAERVNEPVQWSAFRHVRFKIAGVIIRAGGRECTGIRLCEVSDVSIRRMEIVGVPPVTVAVMAPSDIVVAAIEIRVVIAPSRVSSIAAFTRLLVSPQRSQFSFRATNADGVTVVSFPEMVVADWFRAASTAYGHTTSAMVVEQKARLLVADLRVPVGFAGVSHGDSSIPFFGQKQHGCRQPCADWERFNLV